MRNRRKGDRQEKERSQEQTSRASRRAERKGGTRKGKTSRREEGSTDTSKELRNFQRKASEAWDALPKAKRIRIRQKYKAKRNHFSPTDWYHKITSAREVSGQAFAGLSKKALRKAIGLPAKPLTMGSSKMVDKKVRIKAKKMPAPPTNPYVALMAPLVIVSHEHDGKTVIADAGSVIRLADQRVLYREHFSPITHRADEILVYYGKADKPRLGWISHKTPTKVLKPVKGPTFLVMSAKEDAVSVWDQLRFKIGRARQRDAGEWLVTWLIRNGAKTPKELRAVVRFFGGKPIKNEGLDARLSKLFSLILHTELDMANAKANAKKSKKGKKAGKGKLKSKKELLAERGSPPKKDKKIKKGKKNKVARVSDGVTRDHDDYVVRRLIKENPRRVGTEKAKTWSRLKKGMTVGEFVAKGGYCTRSEIGRYIEAGWVKLLRPKGDSDD